MIETFTEDGDLFDAPSNKEEFGDINIMISRWEADGEIEEAEECKAGQACEKDVLGARG